MSLPSSASVNAAATTAEGMCSLSYEPLDVDRVIKTVQDDTAGATAIFIGTTRNSFQGKIVTRLEYQAYSKLAIKTMAGIMHEAHGLISQSEHEVASQKLTSPLIRCAIHHRLGTVPVGEPSIIIAVSSPHRKEAFRICEFLLEEVKRKVQIWKRECYEGEDESTAQWKENV